MKVGNILNTIAYSNVMKKFMQPGDYEKVLSLLKKVKRKLR